MQTSKDGLSYNGKIVSGWGGMARAEADATAVVHEMNEQGEAQVMTVEVCEVIVTAPDAAWLADFTRALVDDRLAACGHNIAAMRSIYRWQGQTHDDTEARVALHTRASLVPSIVDRANRDHPYDVPCVIALPVTGGNPAYLQWVLDETADPGQHTAVADTAEFAS